MTPDFSNEFLNWLEGGRGVLHKAQPYINCVNKLIAMQLQNRGQA